MIKAEGKEHLEHRMFPMGAGHAAYAIVIREIDGEDAIEAGRLARRRAALDEDEQRTNIFREQIKLSVVAVRRTGKTPAKWERAAAPFDEFDTWKLRSQNLVISAYQRMNVISEEELANFQKGSVVVGDDAPGEEIEDEVIEAAEAAPLRPVDALRRIPL